MSNNSKDSIFKNQNTLARRAWIESALECVRNRLSVSTFSPPPLDAVGYETPAQPDAVVDFAPQRPRLYVAWSDGQRRSGT